MSKASTPPIEKQAQAAHPLNIDAQDVQEFNLSSVPTGHYEPFMLDSGSMKSGGTSIFVVEMQPRYILGGHKMGLEWA